MTLVGLALAYLIGAALVGVALVVALTVLRQPREQAESAPAGAMPEAA